MDGFPEIEQAFRKRLGFAPEIPFPANLEAWADILRQCLGADNAQAYRDAFNYETELLGAGVW